MYKALLYVLGYRADEGPRIHEYEQRLKCNPKTGILSQIKMFYCSILSLVVIPEKRTLLIPRGTFRHIIAAVSNMDSRKTPL